MIKKLFLFAVTSGLAAKALQMWIDRETRRQTPRGERADLQRWEDEGGNLPPGNAGPGGGAPGPAGAA